MASVSFRVATAGVLLECLASAGEPDSRAKVPDSYTLDYPAAERWCPPVRTTFVEAVQSMSQIGTKRFRHQPNGGYGLPVVDKLGDKHLVHLGADLGWYQLGEPVFAVAHGVVRRSDGPDPPSKDRKVNTADTAPPKTMPRGGILWGNIIAIEHRYVDAAGDEQFLTTLYGHLGTDRRVQVGDIVQAGQQIGTIGRKHVQINGGFNPHLHFGVREGRRAEIGAALMQIRFEGRPSTLRMVSLDKNQVLLKAEHPVTRDISVRVNGQEFSFAPQGDHYAAPARVLWFASYPEFPLIGYDLSTKGWRDPIETLRSFRADTDPAPFQLAKRPR